MRDAAGQSSLLRTACLVELVGPFSLLPEPEGNSMLFLPFSPLPSLPIFAPTGEQALLHYDCLFMRVVPLLNPVREEYEYRGDR